MATTDVASADKLGLITASSPLAVATGRSGGKGFGLYKLAAVGAAVPAWAVLGFDVVERVCAEGGLDRAIGAALRGVSEEADDDALEAAAAEVSKLFSALELDAEIVSLIDRAYEHVGGGAVAVRSSAAGEDGAKLSFAGQYESFLNVMGLDGVIQAVRDCWASAWSASATRYRLHNDLSVDGIEIAVVIQAMVPAEKSGVLFTANPATGSSDEFVVSASYGLGEAIVSGSVDPDTVVLSRTSGGVKEKTLGAKEERIDPRAEGGCETRPVPWSDRVNSVLSVAELEELHSIGLALDQALGEGQDIEWAISGSRVWVLQCRPITALGQGSSEGGQVRLWDNSNIIESYGGTVSPLTFSFARHAYERVYTQYCALLGVPKRQRASIDEWLPQLLGYFDGRVYYNLLNWYRLARLIPFYSINRRVLELSMGADHLDDEIAEEQHAYAFRNRVEAVAVRGWVGAHFFWYFLTIHRLVDDFVAKFYKEYDELNSLDYDGREDHQLYEMFVEMEKRLLVRWGRMIMLEYSVGLSVGVLYGMTQRWLPEAPEWFLFDAVKDGADIESVEPAQKLDEIARSIASDPVLLDLVQTTPVERLDSILRGSDEGSAKAAVADIDRYLDEFGYRNANELKLEEPDLREDPVSFFLLLRGALGRLAVGEATARQERPTADAYLGANLRGWRRRVFEWQRRRVQRLLADRERVRFCRTRIFGLSRRMFRASGQALERSGVLENSGDVFFLRLEEIRGCFEGTVAHRELQPLVELRKAQEALNEEREVPPRFWTQGGVYWGAFDRGVAEVAGDSVSDESVLKGTACSPGVVRAAAHVLERPEDVDGGVMVTYRTDPGWVGALSSASALLIERGSPLTHVAVVAREMQIPTIVQIPGLTRAIRTGMTVEVDGGAGTVHLSEPRDANHGDD